MSDDILHDALAYLESVKENYPTGLSLNKNSTAAKQNDRNVNNEAWRLVFLCQTDNAVDFMSSAEGKLAQAAIEKGLKKSIDDVKVAPAANVEDAIKFLKSISSGCVLVLGETLWQDLMKLRSEFSQNIDLMVSAPLSQSLADVNVKKNFWNVLKAIMQKYKL